MKGKYDVNPLFPTYRFTTRSKILGGRNQRSRTQLLSEEALLKARADGKTKASCINGLEVRIHVSGMYFQYHNLGTRGKTTALGKYPDVSLAQAQIQAAELRRKEEEARERRRLISTDQLGIRQKSYSTEQLKKVRELYDLCSRSKILKDEFRHAIMFLILLPYTPNELLRLRWIDFVGHPYERLRIESRRRQNSKSQTIEFSESCFIQLTGYLCSRLAAEKGKLSSQSDYIFPSPASNITHLWEKDVNQAIQAIYKEHQISEPHLRAKDFRDIFRSQMISLKHFDERFIQSMLQGFKSTQEGLPDRERYNTARYILDVWYQWIAYPDVRL